MTTCITFSTHLSIAHIDDPSINVYKLKEGATPTQVGVDGTLVHNAGLRKSKSIRDKFKLAYIPEELSCYFTKLKLGIGSKHIYEQGDFMKRHYDTRLPDLDGLPHIMTLIVTTKDGLENLLVNDKQPQIPNSSGLYNTCAVLFSLNCPHEVLPIPSYQERYSFVFPIYGTYNPASKINAIIQETGAVKNMYDIVWEVIQSKIDQPQDLDSRSLSRFHGYIHILNDFVLDGMTINLRRLADPHYYMSDKVQYDGEDSETMFVRVKYQLPDGITINRVISKAIEIPIATNIKLAPLSKVENLLLNMRERVVELQREAFNACKDVRIKTLDDVLEKIEPDAPTMIILLGKYFQGSELQDLITADSYVYKRLLGMGREVQFVPTAAIDNLFMPTVYIDEENCNKLISDLEIEFDDGSEYTPRYKLVHGALIVI